MEGERGIKACCRERRGGREIEVGGERTQAKETNSDVSKLLPEMPALQVFDEKSERVFVQKAPLSISKGTNPLIYPPNLPWNALKTQCYRVMVYKLHENEYGKALVKPYVKDKNVMNGTNVFVVKFETKHDTALYYKIHEDEHGKYGRKGRYKERDEGRGPVWFITGLRVTFLNKVYIQNLLLKHINVQSRFDNYPEFYFETIPDVLSKDHPRFIDKLLDLADGIEEVMKPYFKEMLTQGNLSSKSSRPVAFIIADGGYTVPVDIAKNVGIPVELYFDTICGYETQGACAMKTLQLAFKGILKWSIQATKSDVLGSIVYSISITSSYDYELQGSNHTDHGELSSEQVYRLQSIVERLRSAGCLGDCIEVYKNSRKSAVDTRFLRFCIGKWTIMDLKRLGGQEFTAKIRIWILTAYKCYNSIFPGEKRYFEQIFVGLGAVTYARHFLSCCKVDLLETLEFSTKVDDYNYAILLLDMLIGKKTTDPILLEGFKLQNFVSNALADGSVKEIIDPVNIHGLIQDEAAQVEDCLSILFNIGMKCASELPQFRPEISDILSMLETVRGIFEINTGSTETYANKSSKATVLTAQRNMQSLLTKKMAPNSSTISMLPSVTVSYMDLLASNSPDEQLIGAQILQNFASNDRFVDDTLQKIGITIPVMERLIEMSNWKDPQEEEIRHSAAEILSRLAGKKQNSLRVAGIPGAMESISSLLHVSRTSTAASDEIFEKRIIFYNEKYGLGTFNHLGLLILKKLARDHDNCGKIGNIRGLLQKIIDFTHAGERLLKGDKASPSQILTVKRSLQVVRMLASSTGATGKQLRKEISEVVLTISNIRDILRCGEKHPMPQNLGIEILTSLALEEDATERIGGLSGVLKELFNNFFKQELPGNQNQVKIAAGEALCYGIEFFTVYGEASLYEIQEVVGQGSYVVVAAAVDTHTGEKVAIIKINDVFEHVSDATRILLGEIKLVRLLQHPDVVEIKHIMLPPCRKESKDIYVVFKLMESDLHQVIKANDTLIPGHHQIFLWTLLSTLQAFERMHRPLKFQSVDSLCLILPRTGSGQSPSRPYVPPASLRSTNTAATSVMMDISIDHDSKISVPTSHRKDLLSLMSSGDHNMGSNLHMTHINSHPPFGSIYGPTASQMGNYVSTLRTRSFFGSGYCHGLAQVNWVIKL